jgi:hypothetical protein
LLECPELGEFLVADKFANASFGAKFFLFKLKHHDANCSIYLASLMILSFFDMSPYMQWDLDSYITWHLLGAAVDVSDGWVAELCTQAMNELLQSIELLLGCMPWLWL